MIQIPVKCWNIDGSLWSISLFSLGKLSCFWIGTRLWRSLGIKSYCGSLKGLRAVFKLEFIWFYSSTQQASRQKVILCTSRRWQNMAQAPNPIDVAAVEAAMVQQGVPPPVVPAPAPAPMENNNVSLVAFSRCLGLSELLFWTCNPRSSCQAGLAFFYPSCTPSIVTMGLKFRC